MLDKAQLTAAKIISGCRLKTTWSNDVVAGLNRWSKPHKLTSTHWNIFAPLFLQIDLWHCALPLSCQFFQIVQIIRSLCFASKP